MLTVSRNSRWRFVLLALLVVSAPSWSAAVSRVWAGETAAEIEARLKEDLKYLASDELEGRGVGTLGLDKAADHLAAEFAKMGLKTDLFDGGPFQKFEITALVERGPAEQNLLTLVGLGKEPGQPLERRVLELGKDFQTLGVGGSTSLDAPLVLVGYGITAKEHKYDDYAGLDVKDKVVVMLRKEPQQADPKSVFDGARPSQHALFNRKIANAFEHGAAGIVFVNDLYDLQQKRQSDEKAWKEALDKLADLRKAFAARTDATPDDEAKHRQEANQLVEQLHTINGRLAGDYDQVLDFNGAGTDSSHPKLAVFFAKRAAVDALCQAAGGPDLATVESQIDADLQPRSRELKNCSAVGQSNVVRKMAQVKNVVAVLEGEGPLANETVVVGAHYDHVGRGGPGSGSLATGPWTNDVHNGADDNGSGTVALLEVARHFAGQSDKPRRRMVFIAFTAEERGLLGSAKYVREPRFPLESTVAMVNMDMVGRLNDNKLMVYGTGTATEFDPLINELNKKYDFAITKHPEGVGPSDHSSFYVRQIPVFHFFTGTHQDYHRPSDDENKVNYPGMRQITQMVTEVVDSIVRADKRPEYKEVKGSQAARGGDRPYFGSIPDFGAEGLGYALMGVVKGSPAELAGLKAGDLIVKLADSQIGSLDDFDSALRKFKAGDKVPVTVKRGEQTLTVTVTLAPPR